MVLVFVLFQSYKDVKSMLYWLYPDLRNYSPKKEVSYNFRI